MAVPFIWLPEHHGGARRRNSGGKVKLPFSRPPANSDLLKKREAFAIGSQVVVQSGKVLKLLIRPMARFVGDETRSIRLAGEHGR